MKNFPEAIEIQLKIAGRLLENCWKSVEVVGKIMYGRMGALKLEDSEHLDSGL